MNSGPEGEIFRIFPKKDREVAWGSAGGGKCGRAGNPVGRSAGIDSEFGEHDGDDMIPVVEEDPFEESREPLKEGGPGAVAKAEGAVAVVEELEGRMHEKGQDVHRGQKIGEMALSVAEIMLETIAPDLQGLDMFVLDFPSGPAGLGERDERAWGDRMIGDPGVVVEDLAGVFIGHGEFKPVCQEGIVRIAERKIGHKAEGPAFPDDLGDPLALGLPLTLFEDDAVGFDLPGSGEVVDPLVGRGMGRRLAGEEEMESGGLHRLAEGLVGI